MGYRLKPPPRDTDRYEKWAGDVWGKTENTFKAALAKKFVFKYFSKKCFGKRVLDIKKRDVQKFKS